MEPSVAKSASPAVARPAVKSAPSAAATPAAAQKTEGPATSPKGRKTAKEGAASGAKKEGPGPEGRDQGKAAEAPKGATAAEKARVVAVDHRAGENKAAESAHQSSLEAKNQARAAAREPQVEADGRALEGHAQALEENPPPDPLVVLWVMRIQASIRQKRPLGENDLPKTNPKEMALAAGNEVAGQVKLSTAAVQTGYGPVDQKPPGTATKSTIDIPPNAPAPGAPAVNASQAAPDPLRASQVSLEADKSAAATKAKAAKLDREEVPLIQDGPVADARDAQGDLNHFVIWGPPAAVKTDKETRASATADFRKAEAATLKEMKAARAKQLAAVDDSKDGTKTGEEGKRQEFGRQLALRYQTAADAVHAKIRNLVPVALQKWDDGMKPVSDNFDNSLAQVNAYIKEHKSSLLNRIGDAIFGLPIWIVWEFEKAEQVFVDGASKLALTLSSWVNGVILECQKDIADAKAGIQHDIAELEPALAEWAIGEQKKIDAQFDDLSHEVAAAKSDFSNQLVSRFAKAVKEKDDQIQKLREMSKGLLQKFADFVGEFIDDPLRAIINGVLRIVGIPPDSFWGLVEKFAKVVDQIADKPKVFANNLVAAVKQGFQQFKDNIVSHLVAGLVNWLTSKLKDAGVEAPKDLSLKSILTMFLQILGISWPKIRAKIVKYIGNKNMRLIELAWEFLKTFIEQGWDGVWNLIKEKLDPQVIVDMVLNAVQSYIIETIIKEAAAFVIKLFNPAGIIFEVLKLIYNVVSWILDNAAKIFTLIESVVDAAGEIMSGAIGGAATKIENALGAIVPIVIDLFARLLGLGGLPDKVKEVVGGLQEMVSSAIDKVIEWVASKIGLTKEDDKKGGDVGERIDFQAGDESHSLWIKVDGTNATVMIASSATPLMAWLADLEARVSDAVGTDAKKEKAVGLFAEARKLAEQTDQEADTAVIAQQSSAAAPGGDTGAKSKNEKVKAEERSVVVVVKELIKLLGLAVEGPKVGAYTQLQGRLADHEVHHVPPKALANWIAQTIETIPSDIANRTGARDLANRATREHAGGGPNLASISIHKFTHIKIEDPNAKEDYRVHHGKDTQRLVDEALKDMGIEPIRKGGKPLEDPEDILREKKETSEGADLTQAGKASTQFYLTELRAARKHVEIDQDKDVEVFLRSIQSVFYRAWVQSLTAVRIGVTKSPREGTDDEKSAALGALPPLAQTSWAGIDPDGKVTKF